MESGQHGSMERAMQYIRDGKLSTLMDGQCNEMDKW